MGRSGASLPRPRRRGRSTPRLATLAVAALSLLLAPRRAAAVSVVAASSLRACVNDGTVGGVMVGGEAGAVASFASPTRRPAPLALSLPPQFDAALDCTSKLVATLAVEAGALLATTALDFDVACVDPGGGACPCACDAAADASCVCRDLASPVRVTVTKTPAYATYPLTYVRSFNAGPREAVVRTGVGFPSLTCADGDLAATPTCGWAVDYAGGRVPDSQGFCCSCDLGGLLGDTVGGGAPASTRGGLDCDLLANWLIAPGSAHCLRNDPLWYEGYDLGGAQVDFEVAVSATVPGAPAAATLLLTPQSPAGALPTAGLASRLLGDLAAYAPPPDLGRAMLFVPHPAGASLAAVLTNATDEWLVVDRSGVSLDGRACDRVGAGHAAFRAQASPCARRPGSCLANQLRDLRAADAARAAAGQAPVHLITRWGGGAPGARQAFRRAGGGPLWLGLPLPSTSASLVTVSLDASSITLVANAAPAALRDGRVCAGRGVAARCGSVEALKSDAVLAVTLANIGVVPSDYLVSVGACSAPVLPPAAEFVALDAGREATVSFPLRSTSPDAVPGARCTITAVAAATGRLMATLDVAFDVNATVAVPPPTDGGGSGDGGGPPRTPRQTCAQACPHWTEWRCRLKRLCWRELLATATTAAALVALAGLALVGAVRGWWWRLFRCCCCPGRRLRGPAGAFSSGV